MWIVLVSVQKLFIIALAPDTLRKQTRQATSVSPFMLQARALRAANTAKHEIGMAATPAIVYRRESTVRVIEISDVHIMHSA